MDIKSLYRRYTINCPTFGMSELTFEQIVKKYGESHRFFHTMQHVESIWNNADTIIAEYQREIYYVSALFHDVVYAPGATDNEEKSVEYFKNARFNTYLYDEPNEKFDAAFKLVCKIIMSTKTHEPNRADFGEQDDWYRALYFCGMDIETLTTQSDLYSTELSIFKEYQQFPIDRFRAGRLDVLNALKAKPVQVQFVKSHKFNVGIFAGTFNNFHQGHMNILEKAEKIFDKVIIVCAYNPSKGTDIDAVVKQVKQVLPFHEVVAHDGLVVDYVRKIEALGAKATLVKGFRTDQDIPYELNLYKFTQDYMPEVSCVYIPCDRELEHISSSWLKGLASFGADISKYMPTKFNYYKKD